MLEKCVTGRIMTAQLKSISYVFPTNNLFSFLELKKSIDAFVAHTIFRLSWLAALKF